MPFRLAWYIGKRTDPGRARGLERLVLHKREKENKAGGREGNQAMCGPAMGE